MANKYTFNPVFEKKGTVYTPTGELNNEIWIDVGNRSGEGLYDHHQEKGAPSAYSTVRKDILRNLNDTGEKKSYLRRLKEKSCESVIISIHMHRKPDLDCLFSYYAIKCFFDNTDDENKKFFGESGTGNYFETYINTIESGKNKIIASPTLYAIFTYFDKNLKDDLETIDRIVTDKGLRLIEAAVRLLESRNDLSAEERANLLFTHNFSEELKDEFPNEIACVEKSKNIYDEELKKGIIAFENVIIYTKDGKKKSVPAAIWRKQSMDFNGYIHAREDGCVLTVVPRECKEQENYQEDKLNLTKVTIAFNSETPDSEEYTLRPIAQLIEQMEQMRELDVYERTGYFRRDHSHGRPRNEGDGEEIRKMPFSVTSDPWYLSMKEDTLSSPREWSLVDYKDIIAVLRHGGSWVKKSFMIEISPDAEKKAVTECAWENGVLITDWMAGIQKQIKGEGTHCVVWAALDASLISTNNRILEAFCMNLVGRPFHEVKGESILFLDYRTCIYSDFDCTIILSAIYDEKYEGEELSNQSISVSELLSPIVDVKDATAFSSSKLLDDIAAVVKQRTKLQEFSTRIGGLERGKNREIERINDEILKFSVEMQSDDMIKGETEREIYSFVKTRHEIENLKASVMEEMGIVLSESRNRLVSRFNLLSAYAVPFILIATLFQMGIIGLEPLLDLKGAYRESVIGWGGVALITAVMVIAFRNTCIGKEKRDKKKNIEKR